MKLWHRYTMVGALGLSTLGAAGTGSEEAAVEARAAAAFELLQKHPAYYYERPDVCTTTEKCRFEETGARIARFRHVAGVLAGVTRTPREMALLLTQGGFETNWALYVGAGRCADPPHPKSPRCDPHPKTGIPQARTYFQLHQNTCQRAWAEEPGSDAELREAARCIIDRFAVHGRRCRGRHPEGDLAGAFSGLGRGSACDWKGAGKRARDFAVKESLMHFLVDQNAPPK